MLAGPVLKRLKREEYITGHLEPNNFVTACTGQATRFNCSVDRALDTNCSIKLEIVMENNQVNTDVKETSTVVNDHCISHLFDVVVESENLVNVACTCDAYDVGLYMYATLTILSKINIVLPNFPMFCVYLCIA